MIKLMDKFGQTHWVNKNHIVWIKRLGNSTFVILSAGTIETSTSVDEIIRRITGEAEIKEGSNEPWKEIPYPEMTPTKY